MLVQRIPSGKPGRVCGSDPSAEGAINRAPTQYRRGFDDNYLHVQQEAKKTFRYNYGFLPKRWPIKHECA